MAGRIYPSSYLPVSHLSIYLPIHHPSTYLPADVLKPISLSVCKPNVSVYVRGFLMTVRVQSTRSSHKYVECVIMMLPSPLKCTKMKSSAIHLSGVETTELLEQLFSSIGRTWAVHANNWIHLFLWFGLVQKVSLSLRALTPVYSSWVHPRMFDIISATLSSKRSSSRGNGNIIAIECHRYMYIYICKYIIYIYI